MLTATPIDNEPIITSYIIFNPLKETSPTFDSYSLWMIMFLIGYEWFNFQWLVLF